MKRQMWGAVRRWLCSAFLAVMVAVSAAGQTMPLQADAAASSSEKGLTVSFLDVGQGDAAVIDCDGHYMMIDGGKVKASSYVYSWLEKNGITHMDYMVCTHAHEDHVGGLSAALQLVKVDKAFAPVTEDETKAFNNFVKYLAKQGKKIAVPKPGDTYKLGGASFKILGPVTLDTSNPNNTSIVLKLTYGKTSFLFEGDAENEEEQEILNTGANLSCTVLKVGHHGSETSTGYHYLREASPKYAVISVGKNNSYGHPSAATLSKLRDADVKTFRTDMQGIITAHSDGKTVTFTTGKNADADTLSGAGAGQKSNSSGSTSTAKASSGKSESTSSKAAAAASGKSSASSESGTTKEYVINTNTGKFHKPDCSAVKKIKASNREDYTGNRNDLISKGYSPCKLCNP